MTTTRTGPSRGQNAPQSCSHYKYRTQREKTPRTTHQQLGHVSCGARARRQRRHLRGVGLGTRLGTGRRLRARQARPGHTGPRCRNARRAGLRGEVPVSQPLHPSFLSFCREQATAVTAVTHCVSSKLDTQASQPTSATRSRAATSQWPLSQEPRPPRAAGGAGPRPRPAPGPSPRPHDWGTFAPPKPKAPPPSLRPAPTTRARSPRPEPKAPPPGLRPAPTPGARSTAPPGVSDAPGPNARSAPHPTRTTLRFPRTTQRPAVDERSGDEAVPERGGRGGAEPEAALPKPSAQASVSGKSVPAHKPICLTSGGARGGEQLPHGSRPQRRSDVRPRNRS